MGQVGRALPMVDIGQVLGLSRGGEVAWKSCFTLWIQVSRSCGVGVGTGVGVLLAGEGD